MKKKKKSGSNVDLFLSTTAQRFLVLFRKEKFGGDSKMFSLLCFFSPSKMPQRRPNVPIHERYLHIYIHTNTHTHTHTYSYSNIHTYITLLQVISHLRGPNWSNFLKFSFHCGEALSQISLISFFYSPFFLHQL